MLIHHVRKFSCLFTIMTFISWAAVCLQLCDCARIAARDKLDIDQLICEEFVADVFSIAKHPHSGASVMALRSLINLMNENVAAYKIFAGEPLSRINELITLLRLLIHDNREPQIIFLSTKLMYMLQSQRYEIVST